MAGLVMVANYSYLDCTRWPSVGLLDGVQLESWTGGLVERHRAEYGFPPQFFLFIIGWLRSWRSFLAPNSLKHGLHLSV